MRPVTSEGLPLAGIRVLSATSVWSGPYASQLLADWGCEVIRIESTQHWQVATRGHRARFPEGALVEVGAPFPRTYPELDPGARPWNRSSLFNVHARNQLSMTVDLTRPRGKDILRGLAKISDVFIENNAPTTMERLGVTYDWMKEANSAIIMVRLPAFGLSGPYRNYRAFGDAMVSGFHSLWGYTDVDKSVALSRQAFQDACAGASAALAIAMALYRRRKTGKGELVEVAQTETLIAMLGEAIMDYTMNRRLQGSIGNRDIHGAAPSGNYRCKGNDRWVSITVRNDREWEGFCRALGNPVWASDDRFASALSRYKNQDELDRLVEAWTIEHDSYAVMYMLQKEGVAAAPVTDAADCYTDPHFREIGVLEEVTHPEAGTHVYPGIAWTQARTQNRISRHAPCLGEDNQYVYKELLGVSDEEYAELEREGHIGMDYAPHIV